MGASHAHCHQAITVPGPLSEWSDQIRSDQSLSRVRLFATPRIAAHQASLSITNSWSSLRLTSIESVMPSSHLILCCPLLLLPPIPPSIRVFSNESTLRMRWPKYWSFSALVSFLPKKSQGWSPSGWTGSFLLIFYWFVIYIFIVDHLSTLNIKVGCHFFKKNQWSNPSLRIQAPFHRRLP